MNYVFQAGAAQRNITPQDSVFLVGYPHVERYSTGVSDPLLACALCIDDGREQAIMLTLDLLILSQKDCNDLRGAVHKATGVPSNSIMISCTHTHSAPVTCRPFAWEYDTTVPHPDPVYMEHWKREAAQAAIEAFNNRRPATASSTVTRTQPLPTNRHDPKGPADPELTLLHLRDRNNGETIGVSVSYALHPTVLHADSKLISGDFPAYLRKELCEGLGPQSVILFHMGTAADQSPRHLIASKTVAAAEELGRKLGKLALQALRAQLPADSSTFEEPVELTVATAYLTQLPTRTFPSVEESERRCSNARERFERLQHEGADRAVIRTAECALFGAEEMLMLTRGQASGELGKLIKNFFPVLIQVFRVGSLFVVGLPGELFVEYGLELKQRSPENVLIATLASSHLEGYIVMPHTDPESYESQNSLFKPELGSQMIEKSMELIKQLSPHSVSTEKA